MQKGLLNFFAKIILSYKSLSLTIYEKKLQLAETEFYVGKEKSRNLGDVPKEAVWDKARLKKKFEHFNRLRSAHLENVELESS